MYSSSIVSSLTWFEAADNIPDFCHPCFFWAQFSFSTKGRSLSLFLFFAAASLRLFDWVASLALSLLISNFIIFWVSHVNLYIRRPFLVF
ncbi:hypothetical protein VNO78_11183 [Psophocarpus tetragonolobus]|uniref:Uncharacterized protein n=1 Tax=Psophocarpus tetragonolobus TaxID=3891 RepID=A0AAN9XNF3_PSOTE